MRQYPLNPSQMQAVLQSKGRVLVLAGAGSGKTRVIIYRIAHLIEHHHVPAKKILGLTFTNKAAGEMKERVHQLIGSKAKDVTLCTFHSFCMQVLREFGEKIGYSRHLSVYDEKDIYRLATQITKEIYPTDESPSVANALLAIGDIKNKDLTENDFPPSEQAGYNDYLKELHQRLNSSLKAYNAIDFDTLLTSVYELLSTHKDVLDILQDRFPYIMIDEYQDTNPIQSKIAEALAAKHQNLCVVGDDDQSIYGWRGAQVKNILHFPSDVTIKLEQNYRSNSTIVNAASCVISKNKERYPKNLFSEKKALHKISLFHAPTEIEETQAVIDRILYLKEHKKIDFNDIAILYRSNALSRNFEMALINTPWKNAEGKWIRGIPYEIYGGLEFSERAEVKDLLCYLRIIANPKDQEALLRIINVPRRGISDKTMEALAKQYKEKHIPLWFVLEKIATLPLEKCKTDYEITAKAYEGICELVNIIHTAQRKAKDISLTKTFEWLLLATKYQTMMEEEVKSDKAKIFKLENIQECLNALAQYEEQTTDPSFSEFVATTSLNKQNMFDKKSPSYNAIKLTTFHSAKGLEFPACFIIGLEDHILPHEKSILQTGIEEERRLFYVALTRAKDYLTLSMARARRRGTKQVPTVPSRFLFDIPKESIQVNSYNSLDGDF